MIILYCVKEVKRFYNKLAEKTKNFFRRDLMLNLPMLKRKFFIRSLNFIGNRLPVFVIIQLINADLL